MSKQTVSLVLGAGGARGLAHIGVIERLAGDAFEIRSVAGASMGALIGGIYAMGKLDVYTRWVTALERLDVIRLLDLSFGLNGLFKGDRIIETLRKLIGDRNIEDLPIAFTAVATDLESEQEVWFDRGPLFDAVRASIAIPSIFTPHEYRGRQYLDGSLVDPMPIGPTLGDDTDLTIAVNLSARSEGRSAERALPAGSTAQAAAYHRRIVQFIDGLRQRLEWRPEEAPGMFDVIGKSINIVTNALAEAQLATYAPDLVIDIPRDACSFYEFHRAREMIEVGRRKTEEALVRYRSGRAAS